MKKDMPKKRGNPRDHGVIRRRIEMMYWLSIKRKTNYIEIQEEFSINPNSVKKDLDSLQNDFDVPLIRDRKGIRVVDGWYALRPHLKSSENAFLCELIWVVPHDYRDGIVNLIRSYGNPDEIEKYE